MTRGSPASSDSNTACGTASRLPFWPPWGPGSTQPCMAWSRAFPADADPRQRPVVTHPRDPGEHPPVRADRRRDEGSHTTLATALANVQGTELALRAIASFLRPQQRASTARPAPAWQRWPPPSSATTAAATGRPWRPDPDRTGAPRCRGELPARAALGYPGSAGAARTSRHGRQLSDAGHLSPTVPPGRAHRRSGGGSGLSTGATPRRRHLGRALPARPAGR